MWTNIPDILPQTEINPLIAEIEKAFDGVRLGTGVSLHQADAIDCWQSETDIQAARELDTEQRWQDIPDEKIARFGSALCFMDPLGFRFHMPRYMVWSLSHPQSDSMSVEAPIYRCDFDDSIKERTFANFSLLSSEQRRAIAHFLRFVAGHDECFDSDVAKRALENYWGQFG